jgi:hypothetical protein
MATIQSIVNQLPYRLQRRYSGDNGETFVNWANDALDELAQKAYLPEFKREAGVIVENDEWITPPSDYREGKSLQNPQQPQIFYAFKETFGDGGQLVLKLQNRMTFDDEDSPQAITAFSAQATDSITIDVDSLDEDDYKNYLLNITTGTIAPKTYRLSGNDASACGTTKIYFMNELATALTAAQATAGQIIQEDYYLILSYIANLTRFSAITDEIPLATQYEMAFKAYLNWKAYEWVRVLTAETSYWKGKWNDELRKFGAEKNKLGKKKRVRGRRLVGMEQDVESRYAYDHVSEDD